MKWFSFVALLMLSYNIALADDEYEYKEVVAPEEINSVGMGAPLIATKSCTYAEMLYKHEYMNIYQGDLITQLTYDGYNPGEAFTRHLVVWMENTQLRDLRNQNGKTPQESMTKVYEGDCTIAAGGSADERIPLLTITLDQPFEYGGFTMRVVIESSGECAPQEVCFEQCRDSWQCCYATAEKVDGGWSRSDYSPFPVTTITVATPVVNLTGTVCNQDRVPIPGALIQMKSTGWPTSVDYSGESDDRGNYSIRIEEGNQAYLATVSAPGYATFTETWLGTKIKDAPKMDFTLYDAVEYKTGQRATIMLPVAPDTSKGKYFRMDRTEGEQLIFERELSPQANVPYVIFPDMDFSIDLKSLDLTMNPGRTDIPGVTFVGSYINYDFPLTGNMELLFMDETSDWGLEYFYIDLYGWFAGGCRIAALRACIIEDGWYGKDVFFHDNTNDITTIVNDTDEDAVVYDLQGRQLTTTPQKGIYIVKGKKMLVK